MHNFERLTKSSPLHREFGRCRLVRPVDAGRKEIDVFHQAREDGGALKREMGPEKTRGKREYPRKSPKVKFEVFGEEMIQKEVKRSGNTSRVYLPPDWVGKRVKIIRID